MKIAMANHKGKQRDTNIAIKINNTKLKNGTLHLSPVNRGTKLMYNELEQIWVPLEKIEYYKTLGYVLSRKFGKRIKN